MKTNPAELPTGTPPKKALRLKSAGTYAAALLLIALQQPAHSLNLGNLELTSSYGQPLEASLPVSINRGELLTPGCITHATEAQTDGFAALKDLTIVVPSAGVPGIYTLSISSPLRLTEPMYELSLRITCTGSSTFIRTFTVIPEVSESGTTINSTSQSRAVQPAQPKPAQRAARETEAASAPAIARQPATPIKADSLYRVGANDSLAGIAARVTPAWGSLKQRGIAILKANPEAFIEGDPQRIKAGSTIIIPAKTVRAAEPVQPVGLVKPQIAAKGPTPAQPENPTQDDDAPVTAVATGADTGTVPPTGTDPTSSAPEGPVNPGTAAAATAASAAGSANTKRNLAAELERARDAAERAAAAANAKPAAETPVQTTNEPVSESSGGMLIAVIVGGIIGLLLSLLIMAKRMLAAKRSARPKPVDPETLPRYANDDDFVAPVSNEGVFEDTFVVDETEDVFRETLAADEHAARVMARMEDSSAAPYDTNDDLPKANVKNSFLDSNPDVFGESATSSATADTDPDDTVEDIFNEALFEDPMDPDAPAEHRIQEAKSATEDVQRLAQTAEDQDDEELSATLVEALHLLEQDYQEELSASQVLDPDAVQQSLAGNDKT